MPECEYDKGLTKVILVPLILDIVAVSNSQEFVPVGANTNVSRLFNYTPPTAMEKIQGLGNDIMSYGKNNPLSVGKMALDVASPTPQQTQPISVLHRQRLT